MSKLFRKRDQRINTPFIGWRIILTIFLMLVAVIVVQIIIMLNLLDRSGLLIGVGTYFLIGTAAFLTIFFSIVQKVIYGRPVQKIADAARQVAEGDFSVRINPIRKDGKKDEIEVLIEDFNTMVQELQSTEILKSDFISNVSHEIKSPLSVIQSYSTALKDPTLTYEQQRQYADIIIHASKDMSEMISNILKLNKLEHQGITPVSAPYPIGEQLRKCALNFMPQWEEKEIDFQIEVVDTMILYDDSLLELVWNNLISNAVKFTPQGGMIRLTSWVSDEKLFVKIQDNGPGMEEDTMTNIFDKFYQGDLSHSVKGNGLGLALVKRVLELVEGSIEVESTPGEGSVFTVELAL